MLVGGRVEDDLNFMLHEKPPHPIGVGDVGDTIGYAGAILVPGKIEPQEKDSRLALIHADEPSRVVIQYLPA